MKKLKRHKKTKNPEKALSKIVNKIKLKTINSTETQSEIVLVNEAGLYTHICIVEKKDDKFYIQGEEGVEFDNEDEE